MSFKRGGARAVLLASVALGGVAGCLLVTPLDDLPASSGGAHHAGSNQGGNGGNKAVGGAADGGEPGVAGAGPGECRSNADCSKIGADEPYRCRPSDHTCVALRNEACPIAFGNSTDPNAVYFGAFATLNPSAPDENPIIYAHELAIQELSGDNVGGLPDGPNGMRRPLVMIVCNNTNDVVAPGLQHLAEDVQVPAILATLKPGDLREGFEKYRAHDIFYLSPTSVTQTVATEKDAGLIWNLLGQPSDFSPTYVELLRHVERYVRQARHFASTDKLHVALVTTTDAFDSELATSVAATLSFNGVSAAANGDVNYQAYTIDTTDPQLDQLAQTIADFKPDVVISAASELFAMADGLQADIESEWEAFNAPPAPRPFYILSPYNAGNLSDVIQRMSDDVEFGTDAHPEKRMVGVSIAAAQDNTLQNSYALRLKTLFKKGYTDTANYYDAVYFLAYAMYGADQSTALTGSGIAQGMQRLLAGKNYDVGPAAISPTFAALATAGTTVHVTSTLGPPEFDPKTGVRPVDGSVLCFENTGSSIELHADELRYDRDKAELTGTFDCFDGFFP